MATGAAATEQLTERGSLVFRCGLLDEPPVSLGLLGAMARAAALATSAEGFDVRANVDLFETRFSVLGGDPVSALAALRRHLDSPDPASVAAAVRETTWHGPSLVERCWRALFGATGPGVLSLGRPGERSAAAEGFASGAALSRIWFAPTNTLGQALDGLLPGDPAAFRRPVLRLPELPGPLRPLPRAVRDGTDG